MLTLRKLKKEREAIEKMADPDLEPAEKERLKQAAQDAVRERKKSVAQKAAPPPPGGRATQNQGGARAPTEACAYRA
jgi:hypothetical protein